MSKAALDDNFLFKRADRIVNSYAHFIQPGESWLSVGDGDGYVSYHTQQRCGIVAQGLDVDIDWPDRNIAIPIDHYDGQHMPYESDSFDIVSAIFTLHHCDDVEVVLEEMIRVARKKIVICEDVYRSIFGLKVVRMMDRIENQAVSKDINIPFNFKRISEWETLFSQHSLKINTSERLKIFPFFPVRHHIFCLEIRQ